MCTFPHSILDLCAERWFAVSYPFRATAVCNVRLALVVTSIISFVCLLIGSMQIFVYSYNSNDGSCGAPPPGPDLYVCDLIKSHHTFFSVSFSLPLLSAFLSVPPKSKCQVTAK